MPDKKKISNESWLRFKGEAKKYHFVMKFVQPISFTLSSLIMLCLLSFKIYELVYNKIAYMMQAVSSSHNTQTMQ